MTDSVVKIIINRNLMEVYLYITNDTVLISEEKYLITSYVNFHKAGG